MNPYQNENNNQVPSEHTVKKVIHPVNPEEVKAHLAQNVTQRPQLPQLGENQPLVQPGPAPGYDQNSPNVQVDDEWKPNTTLASRIPALRNYGLVLVLGSLLFMYINRGVWKFSHQSSGRLLGMIIYGVLVVMLISGIVMLVSKSKAFIIGCLNLIIAINVLIALLSLLSLNFIGIIFAVIIIGSISNVKHYVKQAA